MEVAVDFGEIFTSDTIEQAFLDYKRVKTDKFHKNIVRIPTGADGIDYRDFERNLKRNTHEIAKKVLEGRYLFYPFREFEVEKPEGGMRVLSIASIRDVLVQKLLLRVLAPSAEVCYFQRIQPTVSFAYRVDLKAATAARRIRVAYEEGFRYALDADITKFFDTLSHERLAALIGSWVRKDTIVGTLLWRYMHVHRIPPNSSIIQLSNKRTHVRVPRVQGIPQGGILSGLLANLYLHEFDLWVVNELRKQCDIRYFRYADDFVILAKSLEDARYMYDSNIIGSKLIEMSLRLHPTKTHIADLSKGELQFVGYHFTDQHVRVKPGNIWRFKQRIRSRLSKHLKEMGGQISYLPWETHLRKIVHFVILPKILGPVCPICKKIKRDEAGIGRRRNWAAFFGPVVTDVGQIQGLDIWMRRQVCRYIYRRFGIRIHRSDLKKYGWHQSLLVECYRAKGKARICHCEPKDAERGESEGGC